MVAGLPAGYLEGWTPTGGDGKAQIIGIIPNSTMKTLAIQGIPISYKTPTAGTQLVYADSSGSTGTVDFLKYNQTQNQNVVTPMFNQAGIPGPKGVAPNQETLMSFIGNYIPTPSDAPKSASGSTSEQTVTSDSASAVPQTTSPAADAQPAYAGTTARPSAPSARQQAPILEDFSAYGTVAVGQMPEGRQATMLSDTPDDKKVYDEGGTRRKTLLGG